LRRGWHGGEFIEKHDHHVAILGEMSRVAGPCHRQQTHAVRRRDRKAAEVLRLSNRPDQDEDFAFEPARANPASRLLVNSVLPTPGNPVMCIGMRACKPIAIN
jgi:hypothetical protein